MTVTVIVHRRSRSGLVFIDAVAPDEKTRHTAPVVKRDNGSLHSTSSRVADSAWRRFTGARFVHAAMLRADGGTGGLKGAHGA